MVSIAIVGQGYVGLPLAVEAARADFKVIGIDNDLNKVLNEVKTFKNMYKVGDIVTQNSSFNINADNTILLFSAIIWVCPI